MNQVVRVKLFAAAKQVAGAECVELTLPEDAKVSDVRAALLAQFPALAGMGRLLLFAVNGDYAGDEAVIPSGAEVACIPPVSGG